MAFATSNVRQVSLGSLQGLVGDWTGSAGDDNGTIQVPGGRVWLVHVYNQDNQSQEDRPTPCYVSSSDPQTVSVANRSDVTNGRFMIIYG